MSTKALRRKLRLQRIRRKRGIFTTWAVNDEETAVDASLRRFWSQRTAPNSMGVSRVGVPEAMQGFFNYRDHAKDRSKIEWLDTLFPSANMTSAERSAVNARIQELKIPADPTSCVVITQTKNTKLLLYYTIHKDMWWYIQTHVLSDGRRVIKQSTTFPSKDSAENTRHYNQLRWHSPQVLAPEP